MPVCNFELNPISLWVLYFKFETMESEINLTHWTSLTRLLSCPLCTGHPLFYGSIFWDKKFPHSWPGMCKPLFALAVYPKVRLKPVPTSVLLFTLRPCNSSSKATLAAADCHCLQSNIAVDFTFARPKRGSLAVMAMKVG